MAFASRAFSAIYTITSQGSWRRMNRSRCYWRGRWICYIRTGYNFPWRGMEAKSISVCIDRFCYIHFNSFRSANEFVTFLLLSCMNFFFFIFCFSRSVLLLNNIFSPSPMPQLWKNLDHLRSVVLYFGLRVQRHPQLHLALSKHEDISGMRTVINEAIIKGCKKRILWYLMV